jgi:hypothetical protein
MFDLILMRIKVLLLQRFFGSSSSDGLPGSCSGNSVSNRVVFGFKCSTWLIIGSGSCWTRLCSRVSRVDTNPTRQPELSSLIITCDDYKQSKGVSLLLWVKIRMQMHVLVIFSAYAFAKCGYHFLRIYVRIIWLLSAQLLFATHVWDNDRFELLSKSICKIK